LVKLALITKSKAMNHFIVPLDFSMINEYGSGLGHDSKLRYIIKKGNVYREIVKLVNSYKDALVSDPTHGASGFADLVAIMSSAIDKWNVMLGSYARQMAKNSPVPLLSIRVSAPLEDHE